MDFMRANSAGDMLLAFIDWGYRTPPAARRGMKRRIVREKREAEARDQLYADTPVSQHTSRQVRRKLQRRA